MEYYTMGDFNDFVDALDEICVPHQYDKQTLVNLLLKYQKTLDQLRQLEESKIAQEAEIENLAGILDLDEFGTYVLTDENTDQSYTFDFETYVLKRVNLL